MAGTEILSKIGVGSGLNTTEIIDALVEADSAAQRESIDNLESSTKDKISAFAKVKADLKSFNDIITQIQSSDSYGYKGVTSDSTVATITASGSKAGATVNSSLTVTTLASQHSLTGPTYTSTNATVGSGTLTIDFGTWSADPTSGGGQTHTGNEQSQISITTTATTTLTQLRDMINNAATDSDNNGTKDILASVIYDGSNYMLMLKSESGASNEMKVAATSNLATASGGVGYDYNATTSNMSQRVSGVDSAFTVDGISMTRSSNTVSDLFDGFTVQLKKTTSSPIKLTSEVDLENVQSLIEGYVMTYNEVQQSLSAMSKNDEVENENDGVLIGDSTLRHIQNELRDMSSTAINGYEGGPYYLSNLGVKTQRDGQLAFDAAQLKEQFTYDADAVRAFFSNNLGTNNSDVSISAFSLTNTKPGTYAFSSDGSTHSIGGVSATKNGSAYSVSSGNPNGLIITTTNNATSGTIFYGKSFLTLVQDKLDVFLKFNSVVDKRITNFNDTLATIAEKRIALEDRINSLTARYAKQYASMENSVAGIKETGNMLNAMLDAQNND